MSTRAKKDRRKAKRRDLTGQMARVSELAGSVSRAIAETPDGELNSSGTLLVEGRSVPFRPMPPEHLRAQYDRRRAYLLSVFAHELHGLLGECGDDRYMALSLAGLEAEDILPEVLCLLLGPNGVNVASLLDAESLQSSELYIDSGVAEDGTPIYRVFDAEKLLCCGPLSRLDGSNASALEQMAGAVMVACAYRAAVPDDPNLKMIVSFEAGDA